MSIAFDAAMGAWGTSVLSVTTPSWTISGHNRCMVGVMMWADAFFTSFFDFGAMRWGGEYGTDFTQLGSRSIRNSNFHDWHAMALVTARLIAPTVMTSTLYGGLYTELYDTFPAYLVVGAANYTGVNQTTPLGTPVDVASIYPDPPSISVTINPGEWALSWLFTSGHGITPGGSQNQRWEIENVASSASSDDRTGSGSVTFSWTVSGPNPWDNLIRAVALKPAAAGHLTAESGSYAITGQIADLLLSQSNLLIAESGSYGISGQEADLSWQISAYHLNADSGVYMTQGRAVRLAYSGRYVLRVLRRQH